MITTLITHIYNEEYLLPFWLEHHSKLFDHGIIIDYRSTDSSLEICKRICPTWSILTSRNQEFGAVDVDAEVMDIENTIQGFKMSLNTTEFLFTNKPIKELLKEYEEQKICFAINSSTPYDNKYNYPTNINNLIQTLLDPEVRYRKNDRPGCLGYRFLHNYSNGLYSTGRHSTQHSPTILEELQIIWLGYFPWNEHLTKRKLQIKDKMTQHDKNTGRGVQHLYSLEQMQYKFMESFFKGTTLSNENINLYNILRERKPHFRAVILILASNYEQDKMYREVWKQYMFKDPKFKVMFIYGKSDNVLTDYNPDHDIISEHTKEGLGISKVLEAFKLIEARYTYDYFVRTNISTFWDFEKLHNHLDILPKENCYSGDGPLPGYNTNGYYLSGVDTIVTPEMICSINNNNDKVDKQRNCEDQAMGLYFNGILGAPMLPNRICFFEDIRRSDQTEMIRNRIDSAIENNKDHYRVKNQCFNRVEIDKCVYIELLNKIYDVRV